MSWKAGAIEGDLKLNTSEFIRPLEYAVGATKVGAAQIRQDLVDPFGRGRDASGRFVAGMRDVSGELRNAATLGTVMGGAITGGLSAALSGARAVIGGIGSFLSESVGKAADAEQTQISFEVMLGSAERARTLMAEIKQFAAETPFELPELTNASKKLLAFGFAAEEIVPKTRQLGDISSALQIPIGELADLYGKARVQGRLMAEDINQLTGRGIPVIAEFAKQFNVAESEVRGLVESGQIGFANLEQAIASMTSEGGQFAGMMERQSQSLKGLASTLSDAWGEMQTKVGEALVSNGASEMLKELTTSVQDVGPAVADLAISAGTLLQTLLPAIKDTVEGIAEITQGVAALTEKGQERARSGANAGEISKIGEGARSMGLSGAADASKVADAYAAAANAAQDKLNEIAKNRVFGWDGYEKQMMADAQKAQVALARASEGMRRAAAAGDKQGYEESIKDFEKNAGEIERIRNELLGKLHSVAVATGPEANRQRIKAAYDAIASEVDVGRRSARELMNAPITAKAEAKLAQDSTADAAAAGQAFAQTDSKGAADFGAALDKMTAKSEADYLKHMNVLAEIDFDAETKRTARLLSESDQKLYLFDRETEKKLDSIKKIDQRDAEAARRAEERIDLVAELAKTAAEKETKEREKKEKEEQSLTKSIQRELRSRLAGALGDAGELRGADRAAYYAGLANAGGNLTAQADRAAAGASGAGVAESPQLASVEQKLGGIFDRLDRFKELAGDVGRMVQLLGQKPQTVRI